ncbi:hypothetical protein SARC_12468 [Sphaeroforma arctica JP610]|uniref:intramembrane prenyl-peptidase Rce1 n=1 Tax=Sphaeroforma arctica JP610 TaxID=667725 RepID=A0A0L0FE19_9EUKA|nr:hypothetical protein SARC_12468 [Sphaeroforma arctica JP610]KNC75000.1 hypothetical protein SARC_12468 [Sphaeroforma arctica JP610]|eukprot:XP_014148902.1 hypothetical protein SARC_12468 [Sphaeroforma arctica JP610]
MFFGIAHMHHVYESVFVRGEPWRTALLRAAVQFSYTSAFGLYSAYVFLKTGHFAAPLFCHAFCNALGFPDFEYIIEHEQKKVLVPVLVGGLLSFVATFKILLSADNFGSIYQNFA